MALDPLSRGDYSTVHGSALLNQSPLSLDSAQRQTILIMVNQSSIYRIRHDDFVSPRNLTFNLGLRMKAPLCVQQRLQSRNSSRPAVPGLIDFVRPPSPSTETLAPRWVRLLARYTGNTPFAVAFLLSSMADAWFCMTNLPSGCPPLAAQPAT